MARSKRIFWAGLAGFLLLLPGCFGPVLIDEGDNGTIQTLDLGDILIVQLQGNPTTGYEWKQTDSLIPAVLEPLGYEYIPDHPELVGSGGRWRFRFKAVHEGSTPLTFEYRRPWEAEILYTFSITVLVR
jgi:predicted secreted protein